MRPHEIPLQFKIDLVNRSKGCTLNGNPAVVSGYNLDFAKVTDLITGLSAEWAWPTVERILNNGGNFKS